jgi:D-alanyl-D-alanine dipeptidase
MLLPQKFVYLDEVDSSITQDLRYTYDENFLGFQVVGYKANRAILTKEAAKALSAAQKDFLKDGYSIVVYDAYRPQKAVDSFVMWSRDINDQKAKERYYPGINKGDIFKLGYIFDKSSHTRGSTVDISIITLGNKLHPVKFSKRKLRNNDIVPFLDDGTVDMYTSFDLFGPASHHKTDLIEEEYLIRRNYMHFVLSKHGFNSYPKEWWHYTLENEPFPDTYFDFDIR